MSRKVLHPAGFDAPDANDLDPPRVLGYLLPSRSRRELRADRILAIEGAGPAQANGSK